MKSIRLRPLIFIIILFAVHTASAANVFVPTFDLTSWINLKAEIETRGQFDLALDGGYKYQAQVSFQYYNLDIESNPAQSIIFNGASASVRGIMNRLDVTYFTGFYDVIGKGTHYKGHLYHRESGFEYDGFYPVVGTGIIPSVKIADWMNSALYLYQRSGSEYVNSMDITLGLAKDPLTFSLFTGVSGTQYKIGAEFAFRKDNIEFYLTAGTLSISKSSSFDFDDFYFLSEEWFKMNRWNLILSVFTRPEVHYNSVQRRYIATEERSDIDFNFDLYHTFKGEKVIAGGEYNIQTNKTDDFGIYLSPYVSLYTSGLAWKIKLDFNLISESRDFITAYLNLQSSF